MTKTTFKPSTSQPAKVRQISDTYGDRFNFILFLCGYFGEKYLSYEAAAGIDWVWEHRPEDLLKAIT